VIWVLVLIGIIVVVGLLLVALYNRLVQQRNRVDAAHERGTFEAVTEARARAQQASTPAEAAQAEGILGAALGRLFAVAEAYPELQADENFRQLQTELSETENRVAVSRQVYNDTVLTYNNTVQTFPGLVLAGPFGFTIREFFEVEDQAQREPPSVDF
jgi:LemA protein